MKAIATFFVGLTLFGLALMLPDYRLELVLAGVLIGVNAAATDLSVGCAGVPQFGPALSFGIGAYAVAFFRMQALGFWTALVIGPALAGMIALITTWAAFRLQMSPGRYGIVSLLLCLLAEQLAISLYDRLGGSNGVAGITPPAEFQDGYSVLVFVAVAISLGALVWLRRSEFGLLLQAVRDEPDRVGALGYDVTMIRALAVMISALLSAAMGALYAPVAGIAYPGMFGLDANVSVLVAVALGGMGTIIGPFAIAVGLKLAQAELGSQVENAYLLWLGAFVVVASRYFVRRR